MKINGKTIVPGKIKGYSIVSNTPISFLGDINPDNGRVVDKNNLLYNESISGKVFAFPHGKGSTVGSYVLYQLKKNRKAPSAIINTQAETIVAVGAIISEIPMLQGIDIKKIPHNKDMIVNASKGYIEF